MLNLLILIISQILSDKLASRPAPVRRPLMEIEFNPVATSTPISSQFPATAATSRTITVPCSPACAAAKEGAAAKGGAAASFCSVAESMIQSSVKVISGDVTEVVAPKQNTRKARKLNTTAHSKKIKNSNAPSKSFPKKTKVKSTARERKIQSKIQSKKGGKMQPKVRERVLHQSKDPPPSHRPLDSWWSAASNQPHTTTAAKYPLTSVPRGVKFQPDPLLTLPLTPEQNKQLHSYIGEARGEIKFADAIDYRPPPDIPVDILISNKPHPKS